MTFVRAHCSGLFRTFAVVSVIAACGAREPRDRAQPSPLGGAAGEVSATSGSAGQSSGSSAESAGAGGDAAGNPVDHAGAGSDSAGAAPTDGGATSTDAGAAGSPSSDEPAAWSASIGAWCGNGDRETVVLIATRETKSCAARAEQWTSGGGEYLHAELPLSALEAPIELADVPALHCVDGVCHGATLKLALESSGDSEPSGTFELDAGAGPTSSGTISPSDCAWNDYRSPPPLEPGVRGLELRSIAAFQSVKVPLMELGIPITSNRARVVRDRPALFRAYVVPARDFVPRTVRAKLILENDGTETAIEQEQLVDATSTDHQLSSTFNFEVSASLLRAETRYTLELFETTGCAATGERSPGRFPATDSAALGAQTVGELQVEIVPIRIQSTSGELLPDTSAEQIARLRTELLGLFPISGAKLHVREAPLTSSATSVLELLDEVAALRDEENPGRKVTYYGMFQFTTSLDDYCTGSCVLGVGINGDAAAPQAGTAVGVGYAGEVAARTFAHELGHVYGREHSPCGVAGDASYPYSGGRTGSWGYDLARGALVPPETFDFMGYCAPAWVSDYVFGHLARYVERVNSDVQLLTTEVRRRFRTILSSPGHQPRYGRARDVYGAPAGRPEPAIAFDAGGTGTDIVAYRSSLGDSRAELVYVPDPGAHGWTAVRLASGELVSYEPARRLHSPPRSFP